jgi:hypothetical protein
VQPRMPPPLVPIEALATALDAYAAGEQSLSVAVAAMHAAGKAVLDRGALTDHAAASAARTDYVDPDIVTLSQDEAYLSLDDDFSDREGGPIISSVSRKSRRAPPAAAATTVIQQSPSSSAPKGARGASIAWSGAAVRCIAAGDTAALRTAITLAEEAVSAVGNAHTEGLLAWCCTQYAAVCEDPTLRERLQEHASALLESAAASATVGDPSWLRVMELRAWRDALAGDSEQAARAGEAVLRHQPRNPVLCCLVALMRSAQGNVEGCIAMLEWCTHHFPGCIPARALLVRAWTIASVGSGRQSALYKQRILDNVKSLLRDAKELEQYALGGASQRIDGSAPPSFAGHLASSWSSIPSTSKRVVHAYLILSEVCLLNAELLPVADAASSAALEWISRFTTDESGAEWTTPPLIASVIAHRAAVVLALGAPDAHRVASDLLDQSFAIDPTYRADARAASLLPRNAAEALVLERYAARCDPRNAVAAMHLAIAHERAGDNAAACDLLLAAVDATVSEPIYPTQRLAVWFDAV